MIKYVSFNKEWNEFDISCWLTPAYHSSYLLPHVKWSWLRSTVNCFLSNYLLSIGEANLDYLPTSNQIYLMTFMCLTVDTSFIFTKKSNVANCFFDIFNTEIAQCRQKLDVILGTKVVQLWSYQTMYFTKNVVIVNCKVGWS